MKKTFIALSIFAFLGTIAVASTVSVNNGKDKTEQADGGKKKKKKCAKDCAKECFTADKSAATGEKAACTKDASKSCCSKDKAKATSTDEKE